MLVILAIAVPWYWFKAKQRRGRALGSNAKVEKKPPKKGVKALWKRAKAAAETVRAAAAVETLLRVRFALQQIAKSRLARRWIYAAA